MPKSVALSKDIKSFLKDLGMKIKDLAELSGVPYATVSRAVSKLTTSPETAEALANILGDRILAELDNDPYGIIKGR